MINLIRSINERQKHLSSDLKRLKLDLEFAFENTKNEAGVINQGYYSIFSNILESYKNGKVISKWFISEESYVHNNDIIKIPVVDVSIGDEYSNTRIFVLSNSVMTKLSV